MPPDLIDVFQLLREVHFKDLLLVLECEHRTYQQAIIRNLVSLLREYGHSPCDLRNQDSVTFCRLLDDACESGNLPAYFPTI